jgi:uncharacterized DUF497 family protein
MKNFVWNEDKNRQLMEERGISFEAIVSYVEAGNVLDIIENPNSNRYGEQMMYVLEIDGYAFLVPFVESDTEIFLKTVIPSRKATRKYIGG